MTDFYERCVISGPKKLSCDLVPEMLINIDLTLGLLISQNVNVFRVILSPGFGFYAALSVLNLKRIFHEVEFEVVVGKSKSNISQTDLSVKEFILSNADRVINAEDCTTNSLLAAKAADGCSYLLGYSEDDTAFASDMREYAKINRLQIIDTNKKCFSSSAISV